MFTSCKILYLKLIFALSFNYIDQEALHTQWLLPSLFWMQVYLLE